MINPTDIPVGHKVYVARRNLQAKHVAIMRVETATVVKRTPAGYKLANRGVHKGPLLHKDSDYYISTEQADVVDALRADCQREIEKTIDLLTKLNERAASLCDEAL